MDVPWTIEPAPPVRRKYVRRTGPPLTPEQRAAQAAAGGSVGGRRVAAKWQHFFDAQRELDRAADRAKRRAARAAASGPAAKPATTADGSPACAFCSRGASVPKSIRLIPVPVLSDGSPAADGLVRWWDLTPAERFVLARRGPGLLHVCDDRAACRARARAPRGEY